MTTRSKRSLSEKLGHLELMLGPHPQYHTYSREYRTPTLHPYTPDPQDIAWLQTLLELPETRRVIEALCVLVESGDRIIPYPRVLEQLQHYSGQPGDTVRPVIWYLMIFLGIHDTHSSHPPFQWLYSDYQTQQELPVALLITEDARGFLEDMLRFRESGV